MSTPKYDNHKKKHKGPQIGVNSKMATQLEAAVKSKKIHSHASISSDEIFEKWEKGLCELCDEVCFPGHKCKKMRSNYLIVLVDEERILLSTTFILRTIH